MNKKLQHKYTADFNDFIRNQKLENLDDFEKLSKKFVNTNNLNEYAGMPEEILCEFYFNRGYYPDIKNVKDTSDDKYRKGIDFTFNSPDGKGYIQSKGHSDPHTRFGDTKKDVNISTFITETINCNKNRRVLFTPYLEHNPHDNKTIFADDFKPKDNIRVISRLQFQNKVLRDPSFWLDFVKCLKNSSKKFKRINNA